MPNSSVWRQNSSLLALTAPQPPEHSRTARSAKAPGLTKRSTIRTCASHIPLPVQTPSAVRVPIAGIIRSLPRGFSFHFRIVVNTVQRRQFSQLSERAGTYAGIHLAVRKDTGCPGPAILAFPSISPFHPASALWDEELIAPHLLDKGGQRLIRSNNGWWTSSAKPEKVAGCVASMISLYIRRISRLVAGLLAVLQLAQQHKNGTLACIVPCRRRRKG